MSKLSFLQCAVHTAREPRHTTGSLYSSTALSIPQSATRLVYTVSDRKPEELLVTNSITDPMHTIPKASRERIAGISQGI